MVRYADQVIGRLLAALDELALRDKTIVLLTTDNGSAGACRGRMNGREVRGGKGSLLETGIHVPLIVQRSRASSPGRASDQPVDFTDVLPTLLDLCGIARPETKPRSMAIRWRPSCRARPNRYPTATGPTRSTPKTRVIRDRRYKLYSNGEAVRRARRSSREAEPGRQHRPRAVSARQRLAAVLATFPADATLPFKPRSQSYFKAHPEDRPTG